jgi:hypothetical protein
MTGLEAAAESGGDGRCGRRGDAMVHEAGGGGGALRFAEVVHDRIETEVRTRASG